MNTPLSGLNIGAFPAILGSKSPNVNLRSPSGRPGSNFHIWVQNLMGVLTTKFHPYPVNTSQVIPFLRSIVTFPGKKLLTPEGVTGGVSITRGLFSGSYLMSIAAKKLVCPGSIFCVNCLFPVQIAYFPSANTFRSNRRIWFKL